MSYQENTDHIIWSDYYLDLEDWRESLLELYPHYSEDELYEKMYDSNAVNLDDERYNLDINELLIKAIEAPTKKEKRKADREGR